MNKKQLEVSKKKKQFKDVPTWIVGSAAIKMADAIDQLIEASGGYKPSARVSLMEAIVRLSLIARTNKSVEKELQERLDEYKEKYMWIHEM